MPVGMAMMFPSFTGCTGRGSALIVLAFLQGTHGCGEGMTVSIECEPF